MSKYLDLATPAMRSLILVIEIKIFSDLGEKNLKISLSTQNPSYMMRLNTILNIQRSDPDINCENNLDSFNAMLMQYSSVPTCAKCSLFTT